MRLRTLRNLLLDFRRDSVAKTGVVIFGLAVVVGIGYSVSLYSFKFIQSFPAIGAPLNSRLLGLLFLVLFTMVSISTAIVAYTSLFLARETAFFFEQPLSPVPIFFAKAIESVAFSGWATLILCLPVAAAYGVIRQASWLYFLEAAGLLLLFIIFCGAAGVLVTILLLTIIRRWTFQKLFIAVVALQVVVGWNFFQSFDFASFNGEDNLAALNKFTLQLTALQSPFVPSTWATAGILAAAAGQHREMLFQAGLLIANTLIFLPVFRTYARYFYGDRWVRTAEPAPFWRRRTRPAASPVRAPGRWGVDPGPMGVLIWKDLITFIRAPAQISQFILFLLLMVVYVLSLMQIPSGLFSAQWRVVLYFCNLAALCLILSSFSSRFLFPLISLEGQAFWIIGLAPLERSFLVQQKARFGRFLILSLGLLATLGACLSLRFRWDFTLAALYTTTLCGWLLTALATGFGAAYPSLAEDNPARIAVGLGGTLNFFASALSIAAILAFEAAPYLLTGPQPPGTLLWMAHLASFLFTLLIAHLVLRLGERSLRRMDF